MTYINLINRFWELDRIKPFAATDSKLYFYLLNECNVRRWLNPMELQTRNIEAGLNISRKAITDSRNRLKQRGLIDVAKARGREASAYEIKGVKVTDPDLYRLRFVSPQGNTTGDTTGDTTVTQPSTRQPHNGSPHLIIDKDNRDKSEDTHSSSGGGAESGEQSKFDMYRDHFLSESQAEYRRHLASRYGIEDAAEAFAEFRSLLVEEDLLGEIRTRQDFARMFKYKYCRHRTPAAANQPTTHQSPTDYETGRFDRFYRRRSTEPTAVRPEDYTSTL